MAERKSEYERCNFPEKQLGWEVKCFQDDFKINMT